MAMVEEMEDVEGVVEKIQGVVASLEKGLHVLERRTCEVVVKSYEKEIEAIKEIGEGLEKQIVEIKGVVKMCENEIESLRSFKNMVICGGLVMSVV